MSLVLNDVVVPESLDGLDAAGFRACVDVRNAVEQHTLSTDLLTPVAAELLPEYRDNPNRTRRHVLATVDGVAVGRGIVTTRPHSPGSGAYVQVDVLPGRRGQGIGAALLDAAVAAAAELGETTLKAQVQHVAVTGGDRLASPTGFGDVPAVDPGVRFLRSRGWALEQVTRISLLETDRLADRLDGLRADAQAASGEAYGVRSWVGPTPDEWLDDLAVLRTRMSTDAPMAGLQAPPDPWDAARVVAHDARAAEGGATALTTAVEHLASGRLVGFSEILVPADRPAATQEDTLVLREHRGHRLGMLLKVETARLLLERAPQVEAVVTWNAEENRPMLDVNEAMGFRAIGYEGGWQKRA